MKCLIIGSGISGIGAVTLLEHYGADMVLYDSNEKLTKEELELMASAETKNQLAKQAFMFACFTGLRYSDVASLMWGNIQHTSLGQEIVIDSMQKTKRSVRVPLRCHGFQKEVIMPQARRCLQD